MHFLIEELGQELYNEDSYCSEGTVNAQNELKYWNKNIDFQGNKVFQRDDLFDPNTISSWKEKGKTVTGTNVERMASGRAPIGNDGKPINLHHLIQTQTGAIAEVSQSFHQENFPTIHINTGNLPSGIDRAAFNTWKENYWINRANDFK